MRKLTLSLLIVAGVVGALFLSFRSQSTSNPPTAITPIVSGTPSRTDGEVQVLAEGLDTPWSIGVLPDQSLLVTERAGRVRYVNSQGELQQQPVATLSQVNEVGEGGLLGLALHPDFARNKYVYVYYTYSSSGDNTLNRVARLTYTGSALTDERTIVDSIPGAANHNGGRIKFGPDGYLYIGTGDAQEPSQAQDTSTLGGKILRVTDAGAMAPGNPFNNAVYSYGHRNVQGLTWDREARLWATEHGRSGAASGFDELNLISMGKNYGWPEIEGSETRSGMETAKAHSGSSTTWAPAGAAYIDGAVYFGGLRGTALYKAVVQGQNVPQVMSYLVGEYGRIRDVVEGPGQTLLFTTSNRDGRGTPRAADDRVIIISPSAF